MVSRTLLQMERLIQLLKEVDESPVQYMTAQRQDTGEMVRHYDETHSVIRDIVYYATEYLTVGPDIHFWRNMVREAGYPVYPGEVDGFDWLTAYFQMKEGILLFG